MHRVSNCRSGRGRGSHWDRNATNSNTKAFLEHQNRYICTCSGCLSLRATHCPFEQQTLSQPRNFRRKSRRNDRPITAPHLTNVVDRLCCRIDNQSMILVSRLDEILRRIDLLDLAVSGIETQQSCKHQEPLQGKTQMVRQADAAATINEQAVPHAVLQANNLNE